MATTAATSGKVQNWATPGETSAAGGGSSSGTNKTDAGLANKEVFLQMLIAQIKNQNPLNPMDGVQFLSQLSQFTEVEQMLGMRQDIQKLTTLLDKSGTAATATGSTQQTAGQP